MIVQEVPPKKHVIAADGDVHLIVGTGEDCVDLLVSSKNLTLSSPVFAGMLKPHFQEGGELSTLGSVQIALPEDDPQAAFWCCNAMHFQPDREAPDKVHKLLKAVTFIDKYGLLSCLGGWAGLILVKLRQKHDNDQFDLAKVVGIAYALNDHEAFYEATLDLLLKSFGSIAEWLEQRFGLLHDVVLVACGEFATSVQVSAFKLTR